MSTANAFSANAPYAEVSGKAVCSSAVGAGLLAWCLMATPVRAEEVTVVTDGQTQCVNRPPRFRDSLKVEGDRGSQVTQRSFFVHARHPLTVTLDAVDPDHDPLSYRAVSLPEGAVLEATTGVLTWRPTSKQAGRHELRLEVSDGRLTTPLLLSVEVGPNSAPRGDTVTAEFRALPGIGRPNYELAYDPNGDPLTVTVRCAPAGARITTADSGHLVLHWLPTAGDVGDHTLSLDVSDGELSTTITRTLVVFPAWSEGYWEGFLLPGGGASGMLTHASGGFVGAGVDLTIYAKRRDVRDAYFCARHHHASACFASHYRFYAEFEVLGPTNPRMPTQFIYAGGLSATWEAYPGRRHLIPLYPGAHRAGWRRNRLPPRRSDSHGIRR